MISLAFRNPCSLSLRAALRPALQASREAGTWLDVLRSGRGRGPRVVFLPSAGREGAALLRVHALAEALQRLGWCCLVLSPALSLSGRHRILDRLCPDVLVMQGARHVLNRPDLYPGHKIVYDMDDADFHLSHLEVPVRAAMGQATLVAAGSRYIADWALAAGAPRSEVIWTGSAVSSAPRPPQAGRAPVVTWAQTRPMAYLREAALVRSVMTRVAEAYPGITLRLYDRQSGDDPGFADSFRVPGLSVDWVQTMAYDEYLASFDDVALALAPLCPETPFSRGKSFGKVLAALDRKVPVVGSDACEHGAFFTLQTGVITNCADRWVSEILALLRDAPRRQAMAEAAHAAFCTFLSTGACAKRMSAVLERVISDDLQARSG